MLVTAMPPLFSYGVKLVTNGREAPSNKVVISVGVALISVVAGLVSALVSVVWEQQRDHTTRQLDELGRNVIRIEQHLERIDARSLGTMEGFATLAQGMQDVGRRVDRLERKIDGR